DDRRGDCWLVQRPGDRQRRQGDADLGRYLAEQRHALEFLRVPVHLIRELVQAEARILRWRLRAIVFPGEQAAREWTEADDADALLHAQRKQIPLPLAKDHAVAGLDTVEARPVPGLAAADCPRDAERWPVRAADVPYFAGFHQRVQRIERLVDRH